MEACVRILAGRRSEVRHGDFSHAGESGIRQSLIECADAIQGHGGPDILAEIQAAPESSRLADAEIAQPALWAFQVATVKLWGSLGVQPQAVMGHSMGEVSAAVACGALSVDEGAAIVCRRSRLSKRVSRRGAMAMAGASAELPLTSLMRSKIGFGSRA